MRRQSINHEAFDVEETLGEVYRVMYQVLEEVERRAPTDLAWVLYAYASHGTDGTTIDTAAPEDFRAAALAVLLGRMPNP